MQVTEFRELFSMAMVINNQKRSGKSSPKIEDPDKELIAQFLAGEEVAFNRLVLSYQNRVYGLCYRLMGNLDEAEEVAQEIFITIYKSLKDFRGDSRFSTWLYRITVNHCKNRQKYLGRRGYYQSESYDQPLESEDGDIARQLPSEDMGALEQMEQKEVQKLVQDKIEELDDEHKEVILLRDMEGLSYEEIADILGLREGTVKSRIHRARLELKEKLEKELFK
jgi:RNA polymerase sigma-70 factor, ECF subfamily